MCVLIHTIHKKCELVRKRRYLVEGTMKMAFFSSCWWVTIFSGKHKHTKSATNSPLSPKSLFEFYHQSQYLNTSADISIYSGDFKPISVLFSLQYDNFSWLHCSICFIATVRLPSKHALAGPIQDLNGQVRAIRANLSLINPVWDLYGLPVLNPQYHALTNPVWDLYVFACMISATTGPYRSCTGSVWVCLNLQQGGSPKRRETHWRRRLAPTLNNNWHRLCFYSLIPR